MENFEQLLEKYAEVTVKVGLNLQQKQDLLIFSPITASAFVRKAVKKAYEAGARNVQVEWSDEALTRLKFDMAPDEAFTEFPAWRAKGYQEMAENNAAFLYIYSPNPDLLKGVNPERIASNAKAAATAQRVFSDYKKGAKVSWTIVSVPTDEWSAKIYPALEKHERIEALWQQIFHITRSDRTSPIQAWEDHIDTLNEKLDFFNRKHFKKLHYRAPGTDLTIELAKDHIWAGGGMVNEKGTPFVPNIPTEEIFSMPLKTGVNGTVASTKPLNYNGSLINHFSLTFKDGRIIDFRAEEGGAALGKIIGTDKGSHYLGEVALVPHRSPISDTNLIFYNTLFDENASCHLAIGSSYPFNLKDGRSMSGEELEAHGANTSLTHVDFMIGSAELSIDGETTDGETIAIFRKGNWAI